MFVSGNWRHDLNNANRLVWNNRAKLLNRRLALGQCNTLPDLMSDHDAQSILDNGLKEILMRSRNLFQRSTVRKTEKKCSSKNQKQKKIKIVVTMGEERVKILFQLCVSYYASPSLLLCLFGSNYIKIDCIRKMKMRSKNKKVARIIESERLKELLAMSHSCVAYLETT